MGNCCCCVMFSNLHIWALLEYGHPDFATNYFLSQFDDPPGLFAVFVPQYSMSVLTLGWGDMGGSRFVSLRLGGVCELCIQTRCFIRS